MTRRSSPNCSAMAPRTEPPATVSGWTKTVTGPSSPNDRKWTDPPATATNSPGATMAGSARSTACACWLVAAVHTTRAKTARRTSRPMKRPAIREASRLLGGSRRVTVLAGRPKRRRAGYLRHGFLPVTVPEPMTHHPPHALDHVVVAVPDLGEAASGLELAGFYVTARSDHPFGTSNRLVMLEGVYIELVSVTRPEMVPESGFARFVKEALGAGRSGPILFAFRSADAQADLERMRSHGLTVPSEPMTFGRQSVRRDGSI